MELDMFYVYSNYFLAFSESELYGDTSISAFWSLIFLTLPLKFSEFPLSHSLKNAEFRWLEIEKPKKSVDVWVSK